MPHTCDKNITRGGILRYWPIFRSPARLIEVETTSWLHIENCALCENALLQDESLSRGTHVEVRDGLSGDHGGADHLNEDLDGGRVADGAVEGADDGEEEGGDEEGDDEGPPATLGVSQAVRYGLGRSTYGSPE